jgi:peptidoglycan/xylan/chitin deacetylase (PgdA/CDA1 family)
VTAPARNGHTKAQRVVATVSRAIGALRSDARPGLRVLLYHAVGSPPRTGTCGMAVAAEAFADQMRWLREESGYELVPLEAATAALGEGALAGTAVAVTFDDGFENILTSAAPVLTRYAIPFTGFVTGAYLQRPPRGDRYLTATTLRELAAVPFASIGAHGFTHRPLTRLDRAALDDDLRRSSDVLRSSLGTPPSAMSYPHGAVNRRVMDRAKAAGFVVGATSFVGINGQSGSPLFLRRTEILDADGLPAFAGKIRGDYDWYQIRQRVYWPLPPG